MASERRISDSSWRTVKRYEEPEPDLSARSFLYSSFRISADSFMN